MKYSKESLEKLLLLIDAICTDEENVWFKQNLLNLSYGKHNLNTEKSLSIDIKKDTSKIVQWLSIAPDLSVDYSYIKHPLLRTRLEIDNLRMENVRYDLHEKDEMKRLYDFCINAFYQIENLINFYYFEKFPKIGDLLQHLEAIDKTYFKRSLKIPEKTVGDITIAVKIFSFNTTFYKGGDFTGYNIDSLRLIRNEGLHRCTRIKNLENENKRLHDFLKHATFNSIYNLVNSLNELIKQNI